MVAGVVAITGSSGQVGGRIAARLAARGIAQRLIVRDAGRAPVLPNTEVVEASFEETDHLAAVLNGVSVFFMVSAHGSEDRLAKHLSAVRAAAAASVGRIVYLSFLAAAENATFTLAREHHWTEMAIGETGMPFTFLRPSLYLDAVPSMPFDDGNLKGPAGDGRIAWVARDDVADVAVEVVLGADHTGVTYDVTGREALTMEETASTLSAATGRRIGYVDETLEAARRSRSVFGAPPWRVDGWISSYAAIATGEMAVVADTVSMLTGHPPIRLADYLREHPESLAPLIG